MISNRQLTDTLAGVVASTRFEASYSGGRRDVDREITVAVLAKLGDMRLLPLLGDHPQATVPGLSARANVGWDKAILTVEAIQKATLLSLGAALDGDGGVPRDDVPERLAATWQMPTGDAQDRALEDIELDANLDLPEVALDLPAVDRLIAELLAVRTKMVRSPAAVSVLPTAPAKTSTGSAA